MTAAIVSERTRHPSRNSLNQRVVMTLWVGYFGLAPVAWLPGVGADAIDVVKSVLFLIAVAMTWVYARNRSVPQGLSGPIGMALMAGASLFAVLQAVGYGAAFRGTFEIILAFGVLWTLYVFQAEVASLWKVGAAAAIVQGVLGLVIIASFLGWFDISAPDVFDARSLVDIGFAGRRTGWSNGVALFVPFAVAFAMRRGNLFGRLTAASAVLATLGGQLIVGGRAGVGVTIVSVAMMFFMVHGIYGLFVSGVLLAGAAAVLRSDLGERLGVDRFGLSDSLGLEDLSTARVSLIDFAVDRISSRPGVGYGYGVPTAPVTIGGERVEIHVVSLRLFAEGGVALFVAFVVVTVSILAKAVDLLWRRTLLGMFLPRVEAAALLTVLLGGIIVSLVEPNIFLGTMHPSAIWWAAAGSAVALYDVSGTATERDVRGVS